MSTACVIVIGNEILSGRTQDANLAWLAVELNKTGVRLKEARVVPDVPQAIIKAVNECRAEYDYVFTTGGIGPTHDDITSECIAQAFGVKYVRNKEAEALLTQHYPPEKLNAARLKMCDMPEGATLIPNPISIAPGFRIGNVYVMAGIPGIMRAMFEHVRPALQGGRPVLSETVSVFLAEGTIAAGLTDIQNKFSDVEIGSYPFSRDGKFGTSLVARHEDKTRLALVKEALLGLIKDFGGELTQEV
jgi:molybdenum cofactor synthesis domain-containing protein